MQQTAEYIYQLEQEKTRLLSQNCQLKRLVNNQFGHDSDGGISADSPLPKRKRMEAGWSCLFVCLLIPSIASNQTGRPPPGCLQCSNPFFLIIIVWCISTCLGCCDSRLFLARYPLSTFYQSIVAESECIIRLDDYQFPSGPIPSILTQHSP